MSQGKKFLGMLSSETIHKLTNRVVGESNPSMVSNIEEIMNDLHSDNEVRNGGPSTSVTVSRNRVKLSRSDTQSGGERGEKR